MTEAEPPNAVLARAEVALSGSEAAGSGRAELHLAAYNLRLALGEQMADASAAWARETLACLDDLDCSPLRRWWRRLRRTPPSSVG